MVQLMGSKSFGEQYNDSRKMFEVYWEKNFAIELPFKLQTIRFGKEEAKELKEALEEFLNEK